MTEETIQKVLNSSVIELKKMLDEQLITSVDLVNIFSFRCQSIGYSLNIVTDLSYTQALNMAQYCDQKRKENSQKAKGVLFGIPISIKDTFDQKGLKSLVGCTIRTLDPICQEDGFIIKALKKHGAIPFVRTNLPQCSMTLESNNYIFGHVQNPWDPSKSAGGSSGGEGAAIASRISPLGLGSDIGGSIRMPAAFCGVYGFKPTSSRSTGNGLSYFSDIYNGQETIKITCGPIGKSVDDLVLMMKCINDKKLYQELQIDEKDNYQIIKEINEQQISDKSPKKIGYFKNLNIFEASFGNQRAVEISIQKLKEQGHQLIEVNIPFEEEFMEYCYKISFGNKMEGIYRMVKGEELIADYKNLEVLSKLPSFLIKFIIFIFNLVGEQRLSKIIDYLQCLDGIQIFEINDKVNKLKKKMISLFKQYDIQAIVCPPSACPAFKIGQNTETSLSIIYSYMWNIVDFPAGVLPVCKVEENELKYESKINDSITRKVKEQILSTKGMPLNVQIVGLPNQDETVFSLMKQLDEKINFYQQYQFPL